MGRRADRRRAGTVEKALRHRRPGPYQLQAAIAAVHSHASGPRTLTGREIDRLYALMEVVQPSPVVTLNRAVAVSKVQGAAAALAMIEPLRPQLDGYFHYFGVRGALLMELGRNDEARVAFDRAIALAHTAAQAAHIRMHLDRLTWRGSGAGRTAGRAGALTDLRLPSPHRGFAGRTRTRCAATRARRQLRRDRDALENSACSVNSRIAITSQPVHTAVCQARPRHSCRRRSHWAICSGGSHCDTKRWKLWFIKPKRGSTTSNPRRASRRTSSMRFGLINPHCASWIRTRRSSREHSSHCER